MKNKPININSKRLDPQFNQGAASEVCFAAVIPDVCNAGIATRLLIAMLIALLVLNLPASTGLYDFASTLFSRSAVVAPAGLLILAASCALRPLILRESYKIQWLILILLSGCITTLCEVVVVFVSQQPRSPWQLFTSAIVGISASCALAQILRWRAQSRGPALVQARIAALSAHIRPHFFFNALNAVLGVIRSNPQQAEVMIEDLSELFRSLVTGKTLVSLGQEVQLAQKYLAIEQMRLGDRLQIQWEQSEDLQDCVVPQLLLQPLVENAVRHGVEPSVDSHPVRVLIHKQGRQLVLRVENHLPGVSAAQGHQMALDNIRERLMLLFDLEASVQVSQTDGLYKVEVRIPLQRWSSI